MPSQWKDDQRRKRPLLWLRLLGSPKLSIFLLFVFVAINRQGLMLLLQDEEEAILSSTTTTVRHPSTSTTTIRLSGTGAIVILAGKRHATTIWKISRFCLLRRAVRSVDEHINRHYGPYPIILVVARDHELDPTKQDAEYTAQDRSLIQSWAPHTTTIHWEEIDMYSGDALEPNTTMTQINAWRNGENGGVKGRDLGYQSMCRLWSGRLQSMSIFDNFEYYMRIDDDSLLTQKPPWDPFFHMTDKHNLTYLYKRMASDQFGVNELWKVSRKQIMKYDTMSHKIARRKFLIRREVPNGSYVEVYTGAQPYNNFHISKVAFWRSPQWIQLMEDMDARHLFYKYRLGDANVHAMACMMVGDDQTEIVSSFPYVHNSNDMGKKWAPTEWKEECDEKERQWYDSSGHILG